MTSSKNNSDEKKDKFTLIIQFISISTIAAGLFGASFQKGMILQMNLGNLAGSYEIREVFNSAIMGYIHAMSKVKFDIISAAFLDNLHFLPIFFVIGFLPPLFIKYKEMLERNLRKIVIATPAPLKANITKSFVWSPILALVSGFSLFVGSLAVVYSVPFFVAIIILPSLLGYTFGGNYVETLMENDVCVAATKEMLESKHLRQCTQVSIKGKKVMGEIILENSDAYFIRRNSAFLYITKNGSNCIYSIYSKSEDIKQLSSFRFTDDEINVLCNSESATNWKARKKTQPISPK